MAVVDWLELVVAASVGLSEPELIAAFLAVMAHPETGNALARDLKGQSRATEVAQRIRKMFAGTTRQERSAQAMSVAAFLKGMDAGSWPAQVFALDTVDEEN